MTLDSSNETVAILYDIENAPFEMLDYTLGKARRFQPCRTIVVSDWEAHPEQKRWERLLRRPGFTFRQISRTYHGKNSLDSAIYDSAKILYDEGVRKFFIITTDSDFVEIAKLLNSDTPSYIVGVGTKQASETLRSAYSEFLVYPPEEKKKAKKPAKAEKDVEEKPAKAVAKKADDKSAAKIEKATKTKKKVKEVAAKDVAPTKKSKAAKTGKTNDTAAVLAEKSTKATKADKSAMTANGDKTTKATKAKKPAVPDIDGALTVKLPKTLRAALEERRAAEDVSLDELVTFLLMRGINN